MTEIIEEETVNLEAEESFAVNGRGEDTAPDETPA